MGKEQELQIRSEMAAAGADFLTGENFYAQELLGVHPAENGYHFRVWAPAAQAVFLVGDFNDWQDDLPLSLNAATGIWEIETQLPQEGQLYKYKIRQADGKVLMKIDPFALSFEQRPGSAAVVYTPPVKKWRDALWLGRRQRSNFFKRPLNIYELHASSWRQHPDGRPYSFADLKEQLLPYLLQMNYTHVEFMPLMEHPLGASWGYQLLGYFALSSYYGTPEEFQDFVEACHLQNIGVLVDWVPGHFCANEDGLAYYDGTPQYEYMDPDRARNVRWGSSNFDLGKPQVQSFLISSALFWLDFYHLDGIRVDAVSNMIYRDYDEGPWMLNHEGGRCNLEGYYFLQKLTAVVKQQHPEVLLIAEESSAETKITGARSEQGLGFDFKWNMGWMNDTLRFYEMDPYFRRDHFQLLTFSFMYMLQENFILALSHDEVVHGKKSFMHKMWGERDQQFAQLRNLYTFMMTHPGKKLLFMGSEWGQFLEWKYDEGLEWCDLQDPLNRQMQGFTAALNRFYKENPALWELENTPAAIEIIDADNTAETVLSYLRQGKRKKDFLIVVLNMTPVERRDFHVGVPYPGSYKEVWNTEMAAFGGTWQKHNPDRRSQPIAFKHYEQLIKTTVPALGAVILKPQTIQLKKKGGG